MSSVLDYKLPSDWQESELDNIIDPNSKITYGVVQPGKEDVNGVPFVRGGDIFNGRISIEKLRTISKDVSDAYNRTLLKGGELLMSLVGYPGEVAIVPSSLAGANIARQAAYIKLGELVDCKYVMYYLQSDLGKCFLFKKTTGSAQQVINLIDLKEVNVLCPPLGEQKKIAFILTSVDEVIEKIEAQISKLQDLKEGMMQELMTKGIGHTEFKDSPVGRIPKEWECMKLNSIAKVTDGAHHTPTYTPSGVPFLRVTDLKKKNVFQGNIKYVSEEEHQLLIKRCKPEKGDILYSKNGTIGIPRLIDWDDEFSIFVSLALIKIHSNHATKEFLALFMDSPFVREQIRIRSKQGAVTNLHLEEIRDFDIPLPGQNEQKKISHTLNSIGGRLEFAQEELLMHQNMKKALMQDLLTGKVRVKTD